MQICPGCGKRTLGTLIERDLSDVFSLDEISPYCGECVIKYNLNKGKCFLDFLKGKAYAYGDDEDDPPESAPMSNLTRFSILGGWILLGIFLFIFIEDLFLIYIILTGLFLFFAFHKTDIADINESSDYFLNLPLSTQIKIKRAKERERQKLNKDI